jgi:hypothetical protein
MEVVNETGTPAVRFTINSQSSLLGANNIDTIIDGLTQLRGSMQPPHPLEPIREHNYPLEVDPCWRVDWSPLFDGPVLLLRHVGIGWTAFALPHRSIAQLLDALKAKPVATAANMLMN